MSSSEGHPAVLRASGLHGGAGGPRKTPGVEPDRTSTSEVFEGLRLGQPPWPALPMRPTSIGEPAPSTTGTVGVPGQFRVIVRISGAFHEARARPGRAADVFRGEPAVSRSALQDGLDWLVAGVCIADGPVPDDDGRALRVGEVRVAPFQERHERGPQRPALLGEFVGEALSIPGLLIGHAAHHSRGHQGLEPSRQEISGDPEAGVELAEPARAVQRSRTISRDQRSPTTEILVRNEGFDPADPVTRSVSWLWLHRPAGIHVGGEPADAPRYKVVPSVPEGQLDEHKRASVIAEVTEAILDAENGAWPRDAGRIWVFPTEIPEVTGAARAGSGRSQRSSPDSPATTPSGPVRSRVSGSLPPEPNTPACPDERRMM